MLKKGIIATCLIAATLTGCGDQNPLIGRWAAAASSGSNQQHIDFKKDALGNGSGQDIPVTYKQNGRYVSVTPMANGAGFVCKIINHEEIECDLPDGTSTLHRII